MVKNLPANTGDVRDVSSVPGLGRSPGGGHGTSLGMMPVLMAPIFFPGESHGQRSLAGYSPWGCKELDVTEATYHAQREKNPIRKAAGKCLISF